MGIDGTSEPITVTTDEWSLIVPPAGGAAPEMYHLLTDPSQLRNVYDEQRPEAERLHRALLTFLAEHGASRDRIAAYAGEAGASAAAQTLAPQTTVYATEISGRLYAFLDASETESNRVGTAAVQAIPLAQLAASDPHALVCIGDQYYWAVDIAPATSGCE